MQGKNRRAFMHLIAYIDPAPRNHGGSRRTWSMVQLADEIVERPLPYQIKVSDQEHFELLDCHVHDGHTTMLFGCSDQTAADPSFRNVEKDTRRIVRKASGEGLAHSAHLVISHTADDTAGFRAILEVAPRVNRTRVLRLLNKLLSTDENLRRKATAGRQKTIHPRMDFNGEQSESLKIALETGKLHGVEFVRAQNQNEAAVTESGLRPGEMIQTFKVRRKKPEGFSPLAVVETMIKNARGLNYDTVRVVFTDTRSGERKTVPVPTDANDALFIRRSSGEFSLDLESAPAEITEDIANFMVELALGD